jgi:ribosomal-protein-alanine N-acetyltransferase
MEERDVFSDMPTLETDRLLLRRMVSGDLEHIFAYASDPEVARYTSWPAHSSLEDSQEFLDYVLDLYRQGKVAPWGMVHKGDGRLIGTCGFLDWHPHHARSEIGYALSRQYWGRGLMTEAVREIISFGFETMGLNRIQGRCEVENVASARVMEKAGMKLEGVLREHEFCKGRYLDMRVYAVLRREWEGLS